MGLSFMKLKSSRQTDMVMTHDHKRCGGYHGNQGKLNPTHMVTMVTTNSPHSPPQEKPLFEDDAEITVELVNQKIAELSSVRGRRGAKRQKNIETLEMLSGICVSENLGGFLFVILFVINSYWRAIPW